MFNCIYYRIQLVNKNSPETPATIYYSVLLMININSLVCLVKISLFFKYANLNYFLLTFLYVFNYIMILRNSMFKKNIVAFKTYNKYFIDVIAIFYPFFSFLFLFILLDFKNSLLLYFSIFYFIIELLITLYKKI